MIYFPSTELQLSDCKSAREGSLMVCNLIRVLRKRLGMKAIRFTSAELDWAVDSDGLT